MILGRGLLASGFASRFAERSDTLVFASGVSNSLETSQAQFDREFELLKAARDGWTGRIVYFGSCSVADDDRQHTPYARHKQAMEHFVAAGPGGLAVRLPQVVGNTRNPNTLTNFLRDRIESGQEFSVWTNAERNLIDVDDVARITEAVVDRMDSAESRVITIASECSILMQDLVSKFERVLEKSAIYRKEAKGAPLLINADFTLAIARELGMDLGGDYVDKLLGKYYGPQR